MAGKWLSDPPCASRLWLDCAADAPSPQERSIWHWPIRVGLVFAVLALLGVMFLAPEIPGLDANEAFAVRLGAMLYEGLRAFIVAFFATVVLLTYVRVTKL